MGTLGKTWKLSEETKQKMRKPKSADHRKSMSLAMFGNRNGVGKRTPLAVEHKRKLSLARMGKTPWNKGLNTGPNPSHSERMKGNIPWNQGGRVIKTQNERHFKWKGDGVSYSGLHKWVANHLGKPKECEFCGKKDGQMHWANKSHAYKRDLTDWLRLCVPCHREYDGKLQVT